MTMFVRSCALFGSGYFHRRIAEKREYGNAARLELFAKANQTMSMQASRGNGNNHPFFRRPLNRVSPPTTIELRGIQIHFPFRPYDCQRAYMERVVDALLRKENALLESPTGTGKTLCLLCAALAWQRQQAQLSMDIAELATATDLLDNSSSIVNATPLLSMGVPTIIYASRTHSQLSQVVRELRNTCYRPRHAVLGSREKMCVHPKVKKETSGAADINHDCSRLLKDRNCRYRNKLEAYMAPSNEDTCGSGETIQPVRDMEELIELGKNHKICPFYYTRQMVEEAELILVPYNVSVCCVVAFAPRQTDIVSSISLTRMLAKPPWRKSPGATRSLSLTRRTISSRLLANRCPLISPART
jgi:DEAD_2